MSLSTKLKPLYSDDEDIQFLCRAIDALLDKRPKAQAFANRQCDIILAAPDSKAAAAAFKKILILSIGANNVN